MDKHQCGEARVETGQLRGSPELPVLFVIDKSGVFIEVEGKEEGYMTTSFADERG